jgi:hypothetical protein
LVLGGVKTRSRAVRWSTESQANKWGLATSLYGRDNTGNFRVIVISIGKLVGVDFYFKTLARTLAERG